ncbi:MAG TPA: ferritin-like domain-containing protein [Myxococcales bacterium]|nr:ferritin-like domain-containing protein [Myxococcales bacterium]
MLLSREEMTFDFAGATLSATEDARLLAWVMNQFLYGEVSGIQCGHWLYQAPDLAAARFFSRQAVEEFQHVDNFVRILELLGEPPAPAHPLVRFLSTGMMPSTFEEHVCLEMALGEGFVLMALYAIIDTLDHPEIRAILARAVKQEERHVEFGEERTLKAIRARPALRRRLLGLSLVSMWAVRRLGAFMKTRLPRQPVLARLPAFLEFSVGCAEQRLLRMGVLTRPLREMSALDKSLAIAAAYGSSLLRMPLRLLPRKRLTGTYLRDPSILHGSAGDSDVPLRIIR